MSMWEQNYCQCCGCRFPMTYSPISVHAHLMERVAGWRPRIHLALHGTAIAWFLLCIMFFLNSKSNRVRQNGICCLLNLVFVWLTDLIFQSLKFNALSPVYHSETSELGLSNTACHLHMYKSSNWMHRRPVSVLNLDPTEKYIFKVISSVSHFHTSITFKIPGSRKVTLCNLHSHTLGLAIINSSYSSINSTPSISFSDH